MKGICEVCGQLKTVHKNKKSGMTICDNCYQKGKKVGVSKTAAIKKGQTS